MNRLEDLYRRSALALFFIFFFCIAFPLFAGAAPSIHSVQRSVFDGNSITITVAGFGNNGPNIVIFDDFEGGTNGGDIKTGTGSATVGQWDKLGKGTIKYTNSVSHSGSLAFQATSGTPDHPSGNICARASFPMTNEFFGCWWVYLPPEDEWPGAGEKGINWKQVWVYTDTKFVGGQWNDCIMVTILGKGSGALCGNAIGGFVRWGYRNEKGRWQRNMIYWASDQSLSHYITTFINAHEGKKGAVLDMKCIVL